MKSNLETLMQAFISGGWANMSGGTVEAPTGHFAIVEIEPNRKELREAFEDDLFPEELVFFDACEVGTYLVVEDSNGSVFVDGPLPMAWATLWFNNNLEAFNAWDTDDE